ncbi:LysR family transcriptional regulator [Photobacterium leiognathi]|uniref:LysR family transcriptional regulator n=1 Tax=Photobacterium leiognathi TaxID=553611 RepID=UPI000D16AB9B|nr:LysR family transcriptional regulator [Photobacterium leiognathi]PSW45489.1 LysR family transcriptional regulator [Photobacterium leiognathi subsp. mandapamensis]
MNLNQLPLNSLRAFYASAKHQSFTKAANELFVTQTAVSQQVKTLESRLGVTLFNRMPRGISLTSEGVKLYPVVEKVFLELTVNLDNLKFGCTKELVNIGVVGTFALNWLLPRLNDFYDHYPNIDLRISTNNNIADAFSEGLDYVIRFGRGHWHGTEAELLFNTPFTPLCNPSIASRLHHPQDLLGYTLLQSYDVHEWEQWLKQASLKTSISKSQTITFDSTILMVEAAIKGYGIALAPPQMFHEKINQHQIVQPFNIHLNKGGYWLTRLDSKQEKIQHITFKHWLFEQIDS